MYYYTNGRPAAKEGLLENVFKPTDELRTACRNQAGRLSTDCRQHSRVGKGEVAPHSIFRERRGSREKYLEGLEVREAPQHHPGCSWP